ncbi:hypothetical protein NUW58_g10685 [Xylaria curta]|uniref:Uncharacterized protein n=1 Tax=Xylaria curta TaxID=42375 RepID=A0ACC1MH40_9PEZI|nr:hypothetical protein NUW58_g10685 [Xylaria curta]
MWLRRRVGYALDDWLMVVAAILLLVYEAVLTTSVVWGLGRKYESITLGDYIRLSYWQTLSQFFVNLQPVVPRWSIAVFLIRIFGSVRPWFKHFLIGWVVLMAVGSILANILTFTYLDPVEALWDPTVKSHYRFDPYIEYYTAIGVVWLAAISDLAFAITPTVFVWNLQLPLRRKIGFIALLSGSLLAFLASLGKIIFSTLQVRGEAGNNGATTTGVIWITSTVEQSLVIALGSAPALGPLARLRLFNGIYESLVYLVTFGRSRRSTRSQSVYHDDEVELGQPRRLSEGSVSAQAQFADGTLATLDGDTAKYIKRTDEFVVMRKQSRFGD